ncbi:hypothetical protein EKK58_00830 [Candidatus Dependentiae bacterium]|nr:MAG: hypothetical protein EKK58_00830 [Candidatus Dependentiae bacterium]
MKKKRESGKNFQNYKADNDGVTVYHRGENDAYHNLGCRGGQYAGHLKKCYMNGYKEGQARRSSEKQRAAQEANERTFVKARNSRG